MRSTLNFWIINHFTALYLDFISSIRIAESIHGSREVTTTSTTTSLQPLQRPRRELQLQLLQLQREIAAETSRLWDRLHAYTRSLPVRARLHRGSPLARSTRSPNYTPPRQFFIPSISGLSPPSSPQVFPFYLTFPIFKSPANTIKIYLFSHTGISNSEFLRKSFSTLICIFWDSLNN